MCQDEIQQDNKDIELFLAEDRSGEILYFDKIELKNPKSQKSQTNLLNGKWYFDLISIMSLVIILII